MDEQTLLARVRAAITPASPVPATLAQWRAGFQVGSDPFATAVEAGLHAGQLAFAFAGGYQAALRRLLPDLPPTAFAALLLSEGKRQRPDELLTTLMPRGDGSWRLDGEKSYVAGGEAADRWLVVARRGVAADGRVQAALVVLPPHLPGVTRSDRSDSGFLAALPHARARFEDVTVQSEMIAAGDGWVDHARPFRTLEDVHVSAAVAAHTLVHVLRREAPPSLAAALLACLLRLADCARRAPVDPVGHLLLAAAERELQQAAAQVGDLVAADDDAFARDWRANHLLVALAAPARQARLAKAMAATGLRVR